MDSGTLVRFSYREEENMVLLAAEDEEQYKMALGVASGLGRVGSIHVARMLSGAAIKNPNP